MQAERKNDHVVAVSENFRGRSFRALRILPREKNLDGIIEYDRREETVTVLQPCKADEGSAFSERKAKEMFRYLVRENFPERRQAACG